MTLTATFTPSQGSNTTRTPDLIIPLSNLSPTLPNFFTIDGDTGAATNITIPDDTIEAFVEIFASGNSEEEFWYTSKIWEDYQPKACNLTHTLIRYTWWISPFIPSIHWFDWKRSLPRSTSLNWWPVGRTCLALRRYLYRWYHTYELAPLDFIWSLWFPDLLDRYHPILAAAPFQSNQSRSDASSSWAGTESFLQFQLVCFRKHPYPPRVIQNEWENARISRSRTRGQHDWWCL